MEISVHNSLSELQQTPELIHRLGIEQKQFPFQDWSLPYCEKIVLPESSGKPVLVFFLHGAGSVGNDNFLQLRIPSEPLISYFEKQNRKVILIFPQCGKGFQWVDVPWTSTEHQLPINPSRYMSAALALFDEKKREYQPEMIAGLGLSMGGYGIWDMACRRTFDVLGIMCGGADCSQAFRFRDTRICIYHGEKDTAVPVCRGRNIVEALKQAGCTNFRYREFPERGHNVWDDFLNDNFALDYLFSENKKFSHQGSCNVTI